MTPDVIAAGLVSLVSFALILRALWRAWRKHMPAPTQAELDQQAAAKNAATVIKQQLANKDVQIASLKQSLADANTKTNDLASQIVALQTAADNSALDGGWADVVSELQAIAAPPPADPVPAPVAVDPAAPPVVPAAS